MLCATSCFESWVTAGTHVATQPGISYGTNAQSAQFSSTYAFSRSGKNCDQIGSE
jgi:hypothetical protein